MSARSVRPTRASCTRLIRPANSNAGTRQPGRSHNLYAPFYWAYIPATGAPDPEASGTDGLPGNNFPGYLVGDGVGGEGDRMDSDCPVRLLGHRRTSSSVARYNAWRRSACVVTRGPARALTAMRQTPEGAQKVAIYTDEHGIGDVNFQPGSGFWFNALLDTQPDLDNNVNGGCDLKYLKDSVLGHANITAESHYPNQPVTGQPAGSATIPRRSSRCSRSTWPCTRRAPRPSCATHGSSWRTRRTSMARRSPTRSSASRTRAPVA